jgi:hypothetical protein
MIPVKIYNVKNKPKFMIEEELLPDIFKLDETYIFDLSHPSNFQSQMLISKDIDDLQPSDEIEIVGTPGLEGSQLIFTPNEVGNRFIYEEKNGLMIGSLLNPLILLKDFAIYEDDKPIEEIVTEQIIYDFKMNYNPVFVELFIESIRSRFNGINLNDDECYPCGVPVVDKKINSNVLSNARILAKEIRYARKKVEREKVKLNAYGQKEGGPGGFGAPPRNNFV